LKEGELLFQWLLCGMTPCRGQEAPKLRTVGECAKGRRPRQAMNDRNARRYSSGFSCMARCEQLPRTTMFEPLMPACIVCWHSMGASSYCEVSSSVGAEILSSSAMRSHFARLPTMVNSFG